MKLRRGETAPLMDHVRSNSFPMRAIETQPFEYGNASVLLCFQRYTGCPLCNSFLDRLSRLIPEHLHPRVFVLFHSPEKAVRQWGERHKNFGFNLLADPERDIYRAYSVESSLLAFLLGGGPWNPILLFAFLKGHLPGMIHKTPLTLPAHFIVSSSDEILECHYSRSIGGHMSTKTIREHIAAA